MPVCSISGRCDLGMRALFTLTDQKLAVLTTTLPRAAPFPQLWLKLKSCSFSSLSGKYFPKLSDRYGRSCVLCPCGKSNHLGIFHPFRCVGVGGVAFPSLPDPRSVFSDLDWLDSATCSLDRSSSGNLKYLTTWPLHLGDGRSPEETERRVVSMRY